MVVDIYQNSGKEARGTELAFQCFHGLWNKKNGLTFMAKANLLQGTPALALGGRAGIKIGVKVPITNKEPGDTPGTIQMSESNGNVPAVTPIPPELKNWLERFRAAALACESKQSFPAALAADAEARLAWVAYLLSVQRPAQSEATAALQESLNRLERSVGRLKSIASNEEKDLSKVRQFIAYCQDYLRRHTASPVALAVGLTK